MAYFIGETGDCILVLSAVLIVAYIFLTSTFDYWKKKGVVNIKPIPLFGNSLQTCLSLTHPAKEQQYLHNYFKNERYYGKFVFRTPVLVVKDPELVERVLVKDFANFYNRGIKIDPKLDRLSQHLINLEDHQWKCLRSKLTPVFTSGKLKTMHQTLINCSESLTEILNSYANSGQPFEAREVMANFTTDVIGHCAFGIEMKTLKNPKSLFRTMGGQIFQPSAMSRVRLFIRQSCPRLLTWLKWKMVPGNVEEFFIDVIKETMTIREASNIEAHDYLQLLIQLRKQDQPLLDERENGKQGKTNNDELLMDDTVMTSNAMVFFLAGFETTASSLSSCLLELSLNPGIQDKVREEVKNELAKHNGVPTFDAIKNMSYLDQVISETLRKHPPVVYVPRECTKDWNIPDTDVIISKGTLIHLPIYPLHHDPENYPHPDKFIPERFSQENKDQIKKGTFLPFGDGPRMCIGIRFAKQEMKVALAKMILNCRFSLSIKTRIPIELDPKTHFLVPKGGIWINVENIN